MLQGNTILEFAREKKVNNRVKREVVKRIEKHNNITPWISDLLHQGDFYRLIDPAKMFHLSQFVNGCILTDKANDPTLSMIAGDSEITAQAGNDSYSGTYAKRGTYNRIESGLITNGIRNVWDWGTAYGNGTIASVCCTRAEFGKTELGTTSAIPDSDAVAHVRLGGEGNYGWYSSDASTLGKCQIIDFANERGYFVKYDSGTITIEVYRVPTLHLHLTDARYTAELIETHTISQTVDYYSKETATVCFTGSTIHLITFQYNTGNLKDYAIALSDLDTVTLTSHTYSGVTFNKFNEDYRTEDYPRKDCFIIIGDYIWGYSRNKIVKCNLLGNNDADVTAYDNPLGTPDASKNGPIIYLPNGDWYKAPSDRSSINFDTLYQHNGNFYRVKMCGMGEASTFGEYAMNTTGYGSVIASIKNNWGSSNSGLNLYTFFPYVSTVNNLEEAVTKSADLTMKLTYEITVGSNS
jgi:hypothetical protein